MAVSDPILFANPKAPLYPRLAHGKAWNEVHFQLELLHFSYFLSSLISNTLINTLAHALFFVLCIMCYTSADDCNMDQWLQHR